MDTLKKFMTTEIHMLYNLSKELANISTDPRKLIGKVVQLLGELDGVRRVAFYITDPDTQKVSLISSIGVEESNITLDKKEGVVGFILREGYPVVIKNLEEEPLFLNKIKRERLNDISFIGVPIKHGDRVVGIVTVDIVKDFIATSYLVELLIMISNLIGDYTHTYSKLKEREELLKEEIANLKKEVLRKFKLEGFVGTSKAYQDIVKQVLKIANLDVMVMIRGESGTGKTTIAKIIHYLSSRKNRPFVEVNCAAIPPELLEAELFGYEKGAFTGAYSTKVGKVEMANGGTLFFDEIGDLNLSLQAKLLRFIQTKEFERLGSTKTLKSDARIIVATNKNLEEMVAKGEFREDLYYRIAVYPLYIPPLRERREDIPVLVEHYVKQLGNAMGRKLKVDKEALRVLHACDFPGNVRELINCLTRAVIDSNEDVIRVENLSCISSGMCFSHAIKKYTIAPMEDIGLKKEVQKKEPPAEQLPKDEKTIIIEALEKTGYVQAKAARLLGITVRQLNYRIKKYGIPIRKI